MKNHINIVLYLFVLTFICSCHSDIGVDITPQCVILQYKNTTNHSLRITMSEYPEYLRITMSGYPEYRSEIPCFDLSIPQGDSAKVELPVVEREKQQLGWPIVFATCVISFDDGRSVKFHDNLKKSSPGRAGCSNDIMYIPSYSGIRNNSIETLTFDITDDFYQLAK